MNPSTEYKNTWRIIVKDRIVQSLGSCCYACKKQYPVAIYDIHHLDQDKKDFSFNQIQTNGAKSWYKIRDELKKTVLLCPNCHRLVHYGYITIKNESNFNDEYYEWDLAELHQVKSEIRNDLVNYIQQKDLKTIQAQ